MVVVGERDEGGLGFPGHVGVGAACAVLQNLDHAPTGHIEIVARVAAVRPTVADEGADECGVDCMLVGDSLGMVLQGQPSTVPVSLEEMAYHTRWFSRTRIIHLDRMRGLLSTLKQVTAGLEWSIAVARRLGFAGNPLNEDCEIHVLRSHDGNGKA